MGPFHTTVGIDTLWFSGWTPMTAGSTVAACIGLFLLAVFSRFLVSFRNVVEPAWERRFDRRTVVVDAYGGARRPVAYETTRTNSIGSSGVGSFVGSEESNEKQPLPNDPESVLPTTSPSTPRQRQRQSRRPEEGQQSHLIYPSSIALPSSLLPSFRSSFLPRLVLSTLSAGIGYFLMLAVMTMNVWFFIAVILGIGAGEAAWGGVRNSAGGEFHNGH